MKAFQIAWTLLSNNYVKGDAENFSARPISKTQFFSNRKILTLGLRSSRIKTVQIEDTLFHKMYLICTDLNDPKNELDVN